MKKLYCFVLLAACGDNHSEHSHQVDATTTTNISLAFSANVDGQAAACGTSYTNVGSTNVDAELADARLFVSSIQLRNEMSSWVSLELVDSDWQSNGVALLDFENGTGNCADSGTSELNTNIVGTIPTGQYDAVRFDVGIPFELNHNDSAAAPAPFNVPGMFWTWRGGYKFVRVDWAVTGGAIPRWNIHVGSTGCTSDSPTEAPDSPCTNPNLASIELTTIDPASDTIAIDLAQLVANADVAVNTAETPPGCMSSPMEPTDCGPVFTELGVDFATGTCDSNCSGQRIFTVNAD